MLPLRCAHYGLGGDADVPYGQSLVKEQVLAVHASEDLRLAWG